MDKTLLAAGLAAGLAMAGAMAQPLFVGDPYQLPQDKTPRPDKATAKRRAKNKAARKARKRNRK